MTDNNQSIEKAHEVEVLTHTALIEDGIPDISAATNEELAAELTRAVALTARHLQYVAEVYSELRRRGIEVSLRSGIAIHLPAIAARRLEADLVVKYAGQKMLIASLARLPVEVQRELAARGTIKLTRFVEGEIVTADVPLHELTAGEIAVAFDEGRIRPTTEQLRFLMRQQGRRESTKKQQQRTARRVTVKDDTLIVSDKAARVERVVEALSEYYDIDLRAIIEEKVAHRQAEDRQAEA